MASAVDYCRWVYEDGIRFHVPGCWSGVFDERTCNCSKRGDGNLALLQRVEQLKARVKKLERKGAAALAQGGEKP